MRVTVCFGVLFGLIRTLCAQQEATLVLYPGDPREYKEALQVVAQTKQILPKSNSYRKLILNRFALVSEFRTRLLLCELPIGAEYKLLLVAKDTFNKEAKPIYDEIKAFNVESDRFSSTVTTDENKSTMAIWRKRLDDWEDRLKVQAAQLKLKENEVRKSHDDYDRHLAKAMSDWSSEIQGFLFYAKGGMKLAAIEEKLRPLKEHLLRDKRALNNYRKKLPGFHDDIEKMALVAEETRKRGQEDAYGFGLSVAIDSMAANSANKQALSQVKLRKIKDILRSIGEPPQAIRDLFNSSSTGSSLVHSLRTDKDMLEKLSSLVDAGGAVEGLMRQKYWDAAKSCLSLFVQTPEGKLLKANVEIWGSLLYTGLTAYEAKARVEQFSRLGDAELKAVSSLTKTYIKHFQDIRKLEKEAEQIRVNEGFDK
jgi:hypothetical protein